MRGLDPSISDLVDAEYSVALRPEELPSPGDRVVILDHRPRPDVLEADRLIWQRELAARARGDRSAKKPKKPTLADYPQLQPSKPKPARPYKPPRPRVVRPEPESNAPVAPIAYGAEFCGAEGCRRVAGWRVVAGSGQWFLTCRNHLAEAQTVWSEAEVVLLGHQP